MLAHERDEVQNKGQGQGQVFGGCIFDCRVVHQLRRQLFHRAQFSARVVSDRTGPTPGPHNEMNSWGLVPGRLVIYLVLLVGREV